MNVDSTFTTVNSIRGKFFDKDYYYEKEKGTLNKVSFFMKLILKINGIYLVDFI